MDARVWTRVSCLVFLKEKESHLHQNCPTEKLSKMKINVCQKSCSLNLWHVCLLLLWWSCCLHHNTVITTFISQIQNLFTYIVSDTLQTHKTHFQLCLVFPSLGRETCCDIEIVAVILCACEYVCANSVRKVCIRHLIWSVTSLLILCQLVLYIKSRSGLMRFHFHGW